MDLDACAPSDQSIEVLLAVVDSGEHEVFHHDRTALEAVKLVDGLMKRLQIVLLGKRDQGSPDVLARTMEAQSELNILTLFCQDDHLLF